MAPAGDTSSRTAERVLSSTHEAVNARLRREIGERLEYYADRPDEIDAERDALEAIRDAQ